nr:cyclic nucleotide-binding domain-containing protein [Bradyrhizobium liaoningense]
MWPKHFRTGETIFRKGQHADLLYIVVSGEVELPEINQRLSAGDLFGEIGLFSLESVMFLTGIGVPRAGDF